jgi:phage tail protein X
LGGVVGASAVAAAGYGYYRYSVSLSPVQVAPVPECPFVPDISRPFLNAPQGVSTVVDQATTFKNYIKTSADALAKNTPEPSEALENLKSFAYSYAKWVPGGRQIVDSLFKDIDTLREHHGDDVDNIVRKTYTDVQKIVKAKGVSMDGAVEAWDVLTANLAKLGEIAGGSFETLLDNHPAAKEQLAGPIEQLKSASQRYGPEAKKEVEKAYAQVKEVISSGEGLSATNIAKIKSIYDRAVEKAQQVGEQAYQKGLDQVQPQLDKVPELKSLLNKNFNDLVKKADWQELYKKIKQAAENKDPKPVQDYVQSVLEKTKDQEKK